MIRGAGCARERDRFIALALGMMMCRVHGALTVVTLRSINGPLCRPPRSRAAQACITILSAGRCDALMQINVQSSLALQMAA